MPRPDDSTHFGFIKPVERSDSTTTISRLLAIKPPHCVTRLPRSLNERSFWKASEWRHWLLFYALPCLEEILPLEYWKHFSKLSEAIHMLLRETITPHDIKRAEELLHDFVGRCEGLYGVASLTFNVHQLLHLPNSVRQLGPLWAQSAFVFEGGNGKLVKLVSAAKGLPDQIVERVVMSQQLECVLANHDLAITASERTVRLPDPKNWIASDVGSAIRRASNMPDSFARRTDCRKRPANDSTASANVMMTYWVWRGEQENGTGDREAGRMALAKNARASENELLTSLVRAKPSTWDQRSMNADLRWSAWIS
ncbi:hypothetical protein HPB47_006913 [Ixodes persulcatus]|uniref:Uncharacterized protein n=1 Tax=Ixodes persulcatus TaxID=34615 RepID=A0AC60P931_IXOPE|nr:hypothetical protein HPB47_006913 [Ixodes persulcatus]